MRTKRLSRVRGQVPRKARIYPEMTPRQAAFLNYLKDLGYDEADIVYRPSELVQSLVTGRTTVLRRYTPTFYVAPELTVYDVDGRLTEDARIELLSLYEGDGYEFHAITEADFPFDEYVGTEEDASHD